MNPGGAHPLRVPLRWALLLALITFVAVTWIRGAAAERRERAVFEQVAVIQRDLELLVDVRRAPHGMTVDGLAWPHYERALDALGSARLRISVVEDAAAAADDESRASRDVLLATHAASIRELRMGAIASDATQAVLWADGFTVTTHSLTRAQQLSLLAIAEARRLSDGGDGIGAARVLLDRLQFVRDLLSSPLVIDEMIGVAISDPPVLRSWLESGGVLELSEDGARELFDGVRRIERSLRSGLESHRGQFVLGAHGLRSVAEEGQWQNMSGTGGGPMGVVGWWSSRRMASEWVPYLEDRIGLLQRMEQANEGGGLAVLAEAKAWDARVSASESLVTQTLGPSTETIVRARLRARLGLALLRHALAHSLGNAQDPLPLSPFGGPVEVQIDPTEVRVWTRADTGEVLDLTILRR